MPVTVMTCQHQPTNFSSFVEFGGEISHFEGPIPSDACSGSAVSARPCHFLFQKIVECQTGTEWHELVRSQLVSASEKIRVFVATQNQTHGTAILNSFLGLTRLFLQKRDVVEITELKKVSFAHSHQATQCVALMHKQTLSANPHVQNVGRPFPSGLSQHAQDC